jgi:membrane fusion protein (multidrug efflux system)
VETGEVWVDANFKETDLPRIRPGQSARVTVDLLPGRTFKGEVQSLSPASGSAFSLLPPENATGNWVKVTQRFAVRVRVLDPSPDLRVGASAEVTLDTALPAG